MSVSVMTVSGPLVVPAPGGGTSLEVLSRISFLEQELSNLKKQIATPNSYGLSKVTDAANVTTNNGIALSAVQNNALLSGTLANRIELVKKSLSGKIVNTQPDDLENGYSIEEVPTSIKWGRSETGRWYLFFYVGEVPVLRIAGFTSINQ